MNGVLLINKPCGPTSHDVVSAIKRIAKCKAGHAGTLDPFATGLLVILIGQATKISRFLLSSDKTYTGKAVFGSKTDTMDVNGQITSEFDTSRLTKSDTENAFNIFKGHIKQTPPAYSAIKVDGKKAYDLARKGQSPKLNEREVTVYDLSLTNFKKDHNPEADFRVKVSKGTYIRSLVNDIGDYLKTGAYLKELNRTASGKLKIEDSIDLEKINNNPELIKQRLIPIDQALDFTKNIVESSAEKLILNGQALEKEFIKNGKFADGVVQIISSDGKILGIQKIENLKSKVLVVFNG